MPVVSAAKMARGGARAARTTGVLALALGSAACKSDTPKAPAAKPAAQVVEAKTQVAAASDLTRAFEELGKLFQQRTHREVVFTFGSSGLLAQQIHNGAPFDMFAAANVAFVDQLAQSGDCDKATRAPYARGRIAIWTPRSLGAPPPTLAALADARYKRIAIANPEHAPYGKAAKQALDKLGLWTALEPRIVYGENIRQTQQFAQSGNAEAAIVALSLVIDDPTGAYTLIDDALHAPIDQALIACTHGKDFAGGRAFADFVKSPEGRAVMQRYGFVLPGAAPPAASP
jgi:molybdate transport system substrate-binding protein